MNNYEVTRLDTSTNKTFTNIVTEEQLNNIKISQGLYQLISYTQTYTYYCRLRPPMPGCQPKTGLIQINTNEIKHNNRTYWGSVTYNRELTPNELYDYDLD